MSEKKTMEDYKKKIDYSRWEGLFTGPSNPVTSTQKWIDYNIFSYLSGAMETKRPRLFLCGTNGNS